RLPLRDGPHAGRQGAQAMNLPAASVLTPTSAGFGAGPIRRLTLTDPDAGMLIVWKRGSVEVSVSRLGIFYVGGIQRRAIWTEAARAPALIPEDPLVALAQAWLATFLEPGRGPVAPATEALLYERAAGDCRTRRILRSFGDA